MPPQATVVLG